ncbi:dTDP-4-dehydrorhamnose reductase [Pseudomonas sp. dw_358]|uniref:dTDP-4-dehydrorhamnose reductase n=1 Tax=Pseudomonas sp. dw_358 TaxID=2720083 RepID=UPI001BD52493|nr:dTDP-4-dehydrorhamnose reductase [Pseudomonas sp. dw_358]
MTAPLLEILIIGRNGQVGRELQTSFASMGNLHLPGRDQFDLARPEQMREYIQALRPDLIINAAAHTGVDLAENEEALSLALNATAPAVMAEEAVRLGVPFVHYSTDYVFDGSKNSPYIEKDVANPLSVYGRTKLAGELAIRALGGQHLILRTSWVYSLHGRNFLLTMQRLLQEKSELRIVADQIGAPTWAGTIAQATATLMQHWRDGQPGPWGTYHLSGLGETSWFGFAEEIGRHLQLEGKACATLTPIASAEYPTPAERPLNSRLDCSRLQARWDIQLPHWQAALTQCLATQR